MAKTREIVEVSYLNKNELNLLSSDGSVFMTLREGDDFLIGNQLRPWHVVRVPRKDGKGTILQCEKYRDDGSILEKFALPNHKVGLWALTSGAARRGVFHRYHRPVDKVQALCIYLDQVGFATRVNEIYVTTSCGYATTSFDCDPSDIEVPDEDGHGMFVYKGGTFFYLNPMQPEFHSRIFEYTKDGVDAAFDLVVKLFRLHEKDLVEFYHQYPDVYPEGDPVARQKAIAAAKEAEAAEKAAREAAEIAKKEERESRRIDEGGEIILLNGAHIPEGATLSDLCGDKVAYFGAIRKSKGRPFSVLVEEIGEGIHSINVILTEMEYYHLYFVTFLCPEGEVLQELCGRKTFAGWGPSIVMEGIVAETFSQVYINTDGNIRHDEKGSKYAYFTRRSFDDIAAAKKSITQKYA